MSANSDEEWMHLALDLAKQAKAAGEVAVGSIVVRDNEILGQSREYVKKLNDPTGHAEALAIRIACSKHRTLDLRGCTLYTTTEPCPLCSYIIRDVGVSRVVIGARFELLGGVSSSYKLLLDESIDGWGSPPEILRDFMREECEALYDN